MVRNLLFLLYSWFIVSCVSVSTIKIQVLEPASDPLVPQIEKIVILNRTVVTGPEELNDTALMAIYDLYNRTTTEMVFALADILNESPGIGFIDSSRILELQVTIENEIPPGINADFIRLLCDSLDATAVVSVEIFSLEVGYTGLQISRLDFDIAANIAALWRIYKMPEGVMSREHPWLDTLMWRSDIISDLPSFTEIAMEAAYFSALNFARRISPYWLENDRKYFSRGDKTLRKAARYIRDSKFEEAKTTYELLLDHRNKNKSAAASFNLALIYEIEGDFRLAHSYAGKSLASRNHPSISAYIDILEERIEKSEELDRQLGISFR
jgi:hypothetical protein